MLTVIEIDREITEFKRRVESLYADIERWAKARESRSSFRRRDVEIVEGATGVYVVAALELTIPDVPSIQFVPQAIFVLGAHGQVDVQSQLGSEILVWVEPPGSRDAPAQGDGSDELRQLRHVTRPVYTGVPEGWAWVDVQRRRLLHLDQEILWSEVIETLSP